MKTRVLYLFASLVALISCTDEKVTTVTTDSDEFYCSIENEELTRTSLDQNNNVIWSADDQLVIFKKSSIPSKYQISESHIGKTFGSFYKINSAEFSAGSELDHNVALYPYKENLEITKLDSDSPTSSYEITGYSFPAEQTYAENSFANGAFPMAAISDNYDLTFRNICGGIKLQLKGIQKVTSIKIEGKNSEKLAGNADITVYSDENLKPAITMATDASTIVCLNCESGIQLDETATTEFIIVLPPTEFSNGFETTITDEDGMTYLLESFKHNNIIRSSLLVMPSTILGTNENDNENSDSIEIPVSYVSINTTSLELYEGDTYQLTLTILPSDATNKEVTWDSSDTDVAIVSNTGLVTAQSSGTAKISASIGEFVVNCQISVNSHITASTDYIDEFGINHGKGIAIGTTVWAPVNCGYHETDYPYGKLYQWGRKHGQGYYGSSYGDEEIPIDATIPTIGSGGVTVATGQSKENENVLFSGVVSNHFDWVFPSDDSLWNLGDFDSPKKNPEYDPCPNGWRIPSSKELEKLVENGTVALYAWEKGIHGWWFSGPSPYSENVNKVFLPDAGEQAVHGSGTSISYYDRNEEGYYWSASSDYDSNSYYLHIDSKANIKTAWRSRGHSVRCVQE